MDVTPDLVRHLAELSRLELDEAEVERMLPELRSLLAYFESLDELDLEGLEELVRPIDSENVLRADVPAPGLGQDEALATAPEREDGFFKLPRVVEEGR
ncbi:Asp-tRNA(Asn)/Glu-tRNA(Gln) amidotransferase subunit GatC [Oceanithermus desulfurans]|uniref:Aspartyl/glutamyl-tRNA(Asn/Gln) amidotransferase subunit C n=2 Tax=Oceanithermus desulfurans TaxID=227924 RepID=A0A511RI12_9DEIN|nr:Asp-tRNA(Asn)/Glu-tRNA(Gln) amidotransferase subunit GatC [Oceanithermus desulfurans]MBB6030421.1 aspartyl-tRNA(Asn)/glutamyl-tRNA(Gln) amidotransferase subunit C [Oceanithermus desulfurans]GEM89278.1 aspartyl/glutamyl-tRNA(Asn/Gln) amidotransferase subunit C [Oceanithermus desulfurans NBRC 100063]